MSNETWYAYTDGSCLKNPDGEGGWACIIIDPTGIPMKCSGYAPSTTNQRMEIMAVIQALEHVPENTNVVIYSDSKYACCGVSSWLANWNKNGWMTSNKTPVLNKDLWLRILKALATRKVEMRWVKGHASNMLNNECDIMARDISAFAGKLTDEIVSRCKNDR